MRKKISDEDNKLLNDFVIARNKYKKYKNSGNLKRYKNLQDQCVSRFDCFVENKAGKYKSFSNYEDLKQEGREALLLALESYRPEKGDFYWWAVYYIKTKISRQASKHSVIKIPLKKAKNIKPFKVAKMPEYSYEVDMDEKIDGSSLKRKIAGAINKLPQEQKEVVDLYFEFSNLGSNSITKICKELKISRMDCIERITTAKENLKKNLMLLDL